MTVEASSSLRDYTFDLDKDIKTSDNKLMVELTLAVNNGNPIYLQGITVIYTEETQEEPVGTDIVSTFKYCLDDQKLVAEEDGCNWLLYNTTEGNSIYAYDTTVGYGDAS